MKHAFLILFGLLPFILHAQFPNNPRKFRQGYQTTAEGLIYYDDGAPGYTPSLKRGPYHYMDTTNNVFYQYDRINLEWDTLTTGTFSIDSTAQSDGRKRYEVISNGDTITWERPAEGPAMFFYEYDGTTSKADPGSGFFRLNNATPVIASEIYIDGSAQYNGIAGTSIINKLEASDYVRFTKQNDPSTQITFLLTADATNEGGYFTLSVSFASLGSGGSPSAGDRVHFTPLDARNYQGTQGITRNGDDFELGNNISTPITQTTTIIGDGSVDLSFSDFDVIDFSANTSVDVSSSKMNVGIAGGSIIELGETYSSDSVTIGSKEFYIGEGTGGGANDNVLITSGAYDQYTPSKVANIGSLMLNRNGSVFVKETGDDVASGWIKLADTAYVNSVAGMNSFNISANSGATTDITDGETVNFDANDGTQAHRSGNNISFSVFAGSLELPDGTDSSPTATFLDDYTFYNYFINITGSASSDGTVTLPSPSFDLLNVTVRVYVEDSHSTHNATVAAGANEIWEQGTNSSSITIEDGETVELTPVLEDGGTYVWVVINRQSAGLSFAEAYIEQPDPDTVTVTTAGTEVALADVSTGYTKDFTVGTDGKCTYTGVITKQFKITWTVTVTSNGTNENIIGFIKDNAGTFTRIRWEEEDTATGEFHSVAASGTFEMDTNDWIAPFIDTESNGTQVIIEVMGLLVEEIK